MRFVSARGEAGAVLPARGDPVLAPLIGRSVTARRHSMPVRCPVCQAEVHLPPGSRNPRCPRCLATLTAASSASAAPAIPPPSRRPRRWIGLIIMVGFLVAALVAAWSLARPRGRLATETKPPLTSEPVKPESPAPQPAPAPELPSAEEVREIIAALADPDLASGALERCLSLPPVASIVAAVDASKAPPVEAETVLARWAKDEPTSGATGDAGKRLCRRWRDSSEPFEPRLRQLVRNLPACLATTLREPERGAKSIPETDLRTLSLILSSPRPVAARRWLAILARDSSASAGLRRFACRHLATMMEADQPILDLAAVDPMCTGIATPALLAVGRIEPVLAALRAPSTAAPAAMSLGCSKADAVVPETVHAALLELLSSSDPWSRTAALPALGRTARGQASRRVAVVRALAPVVLMGFRTSEESPDWLSASSRASRAIDALWRMEPSATDLKPIADELDEVLRGAMRQNPWSLQNAHLLEQIGPLFARAGAAAPEAARIARSQFDGMSNVRPSERRLSILIGCSLGQQGSLPVLRTILRDPDFINRRVAINALALCGPDGLDVLLEELLLPPLPQNELETRSALRSAVYRYCRTYPSQMNLVADRLLDLYARPGLDGAAYARVDEALSALFPLCLNHIVQSLSARTHSRTPVPSEKRLGLRFWTNPYAAVESSDRGSVLSLWPVLWPRRENPDAIATLVKRMHLDLAGGWQLDERGIRIALHDDGATAHLIAAQPPQRIIEFVCWFAPIRDDAINLLVQMKESGPKGRDGRTRWGGMWYDDIPTWSCERLPPTLREEGVRRLQRLGIPDPDETCQRLTKLVPSSQSPRLDMRQISITSAPGFKDRQRDTIDLRLADGPTESAVPRVADLLVVQSRIAGLSAALRLGEGALPLVESVQDLVAQWSEETDEDRRYQRVPYSALTGFNISNHICPEFLAEQFLVRMSALEPKLPSLP